MLRPYQQKLKSDVYAEWATGKANVLMRLDTGGGKCLGKGTPVLLYSGYVVPVEAIRPGDLLMGPDSNPRQVLSTCTGREMLYCVTPVKGEPYIVNESHILSLQTTERSHGGAVVNLSVREYLAKSDRWRHLHKGWRTGVDFHPYGSAVPLDPYFLGVWLGDGLSRVPAITTADLEIEAYLAEFAASHGLSLRIEMAGGKSHTWHITTAKKGIKNSIRRALYDLGLIKNKHIPHRYLTAPSEVRLSVLAGLMDTDGHYTGKGFDFISKSERLARETAFLARSLGLAAYVSRCQKSAQTGEPGTYFRLSISGDVHRIPCRIARKKATPRQQKKSVLRTGIVVTPVGEGDYYGFTLSGDGLFLLGDFTVTHNTVILSEIISENTGPSVAIAHRQELVSQLSLALARNGVVHNLIAAQKTRQAIIAEHIAQLGRSYFSPTSRSAVASVDTLIRAKGLDAWFSQVTLWVCDEGHHVVHDNKWHTCIERFTHPACRGLLPTATPARADGKGLGAHADGVAHRMVEGPPMRWLIEQGYLSDYDVVCPTSDLATLLDEAAVSASGDWSQKQLTDAAHKSHIVGDVVATYQKFAPGRLGITFTTDVDTAGQMARAYREAGVPAEVLTGETPDGYRRQILRNLANRTLLQVVAVDIISEGFDLPAIEVVSDARPTQSLANYMQRWGRALRPLEGKPRALIIDHVSNFVRHGPPDRPRVWTLDRRDKRGGGGTDIPLTVCLACFRPYERTRWACPHCGHQPAVLDGAGRSSPAAVDGDLGLLDRATLDQLRGAVAEATRTDEQMQAHLIEVRAPYYNTHMAQHQERRAALDALKSVMELWGGVRLAAGDDDVMMQRRFWLTFNIDVLGAQALGRKEAEELMLRVVAQC